VSNLIPGKLLGRKSALASVTILLMGTIMVAAPEVASATAADCAGGANGFVDIPDNLSGLDVEDVETGAGHWLYLNFGKVNGVTRGWAQLFSSSSSLENWLPREDSVWLDWSQDGGRSWLQCGPFYNSSGKLSITSAAKQTSSSSTWVFRAGARDHGQQVLSHWH
jgi:hypothetical protein